MITIKANLLNVGECIALWEVIGMAFPKDVSHATAGQDLKTAATHPHSERQLYNIRENNKKDYGNYLCKNETLWLQMF